MKEQILQVNILLKMEFQKKIETFGKGSSKLIADNETEIERSKNRRAELTLQ